METLALMARCGLGSRSLVGIPLGIVAVALGAFGRGLTPVLDACRSSRRSRT